MTIVEEFCSMQLFKGSGTAGVLKAGRHEQQDLQPVTATTPAEVLRLMMVQVAALAFEPDIATKPGTLVAYVGLDVKVGGP
jgi:hypothetical protein